MDSGPNLSHNHSIYRASSMASNMDGGYSNSQSIYRSNGPDYTNGAQMSGNYSIYDASVGGSVGMNSYVSPNNYNNSRAHQNPEAIAMERSMLLMQQEAEFGINMYDSLTPADEPEINALVAQGYTNDEAVKLIFDRRYRPNYSGVNVGPNRSASSALGVRRSPSHYASQNNYDQDGSNRSVVSAMGLTNHPYESQYSSGSANVSASVLHWMNLN
jgi:hypothetical protein